MGIPAGVTLIVGGGFHGKSTLLQALERSVYDHLPGDGRELCATIPSAVKIRAEDGRGESIGEELEQLFTDLEREGFNLISPRMEGGLALPRIQEVMMAINRMRSLKVLT